MGKNAKVYCSNSFKNLRFFKFLIVAICELYSHVSFFETLPHTALAYPHFSNNFLFHRDLVGTPDFELHYKTLENVQKQAIAKTLSQQNELWNQRSLTPAMFHLGSYCIDDSGEVLAQPKTKAHNRSYFRCNCELNLEF